MKQSKWIIYILCVLMAGCAAYKELEPVPQISFLEDGYIELLDDQEKFELDEGDKYFIRYPKPEKENTYLVLEFDDKSPIISYLTRAFDDGKGSIIRISDESDNPLTSSVFLLDQTVPTFYWVIENVSRDVILDMTYRYVAVWRYKFEKKHAEFEEILQKNTQSRTIIKEIGTSIKLTDVDYPGEKQSVLNKSKNLEQVNQQLFEIESIFPPEILNSKDQAYLDYLQLKNQLSDELAYQKNYHQLMELLEVISAPQPDIEKFVSLAPAYSKLLAEKSAYPESFVNTINKELNRSLSAVAPYYEKQLRKKTKSTPIEIDLQPVQELYTASGNTPDPTLTELASFIKIYNERANALAAINEQLNSLDKDLMTASEWPTGAFYSDKRAQLSRMNYNMPSSDTKVFGKYQSYPCASALNKAIIGTKNKIRGLESKIRRAEALVPQINMLRNQGNFSEILRLLKQNPDLDFLKIQYAALDELSMTQQRQAISSALRSNNFPAAENALRKFHLDNNFINPGKIIPRKENLVRAYEDSIANKVKRVSLANANALIEANKTTINDIDSLYSNPALYPAYSLTFSTRPGSIAQKNQDLENQMNYLRHQKFPETAIDALYRSFTDAIHVQGVEKARAIVIHGRNYQGDKKKIKNLVAECDPNASKWVTKPKQYRKLYALPVTSKIGGSNQYMAKINLQIPTEANFPVYDVNVKLPQELARHAGSRQWYEAITFNRKLLKNEGRFTITAPDPNNDYIAQITPLQVNKKGNNVLEIRFTYNAFKVLEISVMAQKPIIKKN